MSKDIVIRLREEAKADQYGHLRHDLLAELLNAGAEEIKKLRYALRDVAELIDGYVDIVDGPEGNQLPNDAMRAAQLIDEALGNE